MPRGARRSGAPVALVLVVVGDAGLRRALSLPAELFGYRFRRRLGSASAMPPATSAAAIVRRKAVLIPVLAKPPPDPLEAEGALAEAPATLGEVPDALGAVVAAVPA